MALLSPNGFTPARSHWELAKDPSLSFIACSCMPGSHFHSSSSIKDPAIYFCFKVPPDCQGDAEGLLLEDLASACRLSSLRALRVCWHGVWMPQGTGGHGDGAAGWARVSLRAGALALPHNIAPLHFSCQA